MAAYTNSFRSRIVAIVQGWSITAMLLLLPQVMFAEPFAEGTDYAIISPRIETQVAADKIEVIEFFWYGCPHCYTIEPYIKSWEMPSDVEFIRVPATFSQRWVTHAKVYYALESLNRLDMHEVFFNAIHGRQKRRDLVDGAKIAKFFASFDSGIDAQQFTDAFNSFVVNTKVQKAHRLVMKYAIKSVPSFAVNGRYMTSPRMSGGSQRLIEVLDYLVSREQESQKN